MKGLWTLVVILFSLLVFAENEDPLPNSEEQHSGQKIHIVKEIPTTPVRDQYKTSTCWSFSGISLLETELIRMGKGEIDLSEMFVVRQNYERKAERYIRMHGKINFTPGGEVNDVTDVVANYGILPESVYSGLKVDKENHIHLEMDKVLEEYVNAIIQNPNKELSPVWMEGIQEVLDSYLGELPESFVYEENEYTPKSFARYLGLELENYVMITSFTHQPYYESIILEIPDNWSWGKSYNIPLEELVQVVDSAIFNNYSVAWAADNSEPGFSFEQGLALVPEIVYAPRSKRIAEKWENKSNEEKEEAIFCSRKPVEEIVVTPENRQLAFDNYSTTDDHGMHIVGIAENREGKKYYYVKNSWGAENPYNGFLYVSQAYLQYKTISIMVHKDALPKAIAEKLKL
jgi:bleomycin hydrolase